MESNTHQEPGEQESNRLFNKFPFLEHLKGRIIDYVDPESGKRYYGHVAMYYKDSGRIRIDWDNGATTYHDFTVDSKWHFKVKRVYRKKKVEGDGTEES